MVRRGPCPRRGWRERLPNDLRDGGGMNQQLAAAITPVDSDLQISHRMKGQGRRRQLEPPGPLEPAERVDDQIDAQDEVAGPIAFVRVARDDLELPDAAVVPRLRVEG